MKTSKSLDETKKGTEVPDLAPNALGTASIIQHNGLVDILGKFYGDDSLAGIKSTNIKAAAAIVEAVEGIYGDSDGLREFASTGSNQVVTPSVNKRGYVGIGVYGSKWESNVGTLWRAARLYGADFIFTIGQRYKRQATDTPDTPKHTPLFEYADWEDFTKHLPRDCEVVLIEQSATSKPLPSFRHPTRAVYVLGAEDHGLPEELLGTYKTVEIPTVEPQSMNVSAAGTLVLYDRHTKVSDLANISLEARNG